MKLKFLRQSLVQYKGRVIRIEVWQELFSGKIIIIDRSTMKQISLDGTMGEEV